MFKQICRKIGQNGWKMLYAYLCLRLPLKTAILSGFDIKSPRKTSVRRLLFHFNKSNVAWRAARGCTASASAEVFAERAIGVVRLCLARNVCCKPCSVKVVATELALRGDHGGGGGWPPKPPVLRQLTITFIW